MKVHFYGTLDNLKSCYTFQAFDIEVVTMLMPNAPRFGNEPATITIKNPAMFIKKEDGYHRFVIEDFEVEVKKGEFLIEEAELKDIIQRQLYGFPIYISSYRSLTGTPSLFAMSGK